jgi:hypothetical protein
LEAPVVPPNVTMASPNEFPVPECAGRVGSVRFGGHDEYLPEDWVAPRKEFMVEGIDGNSYMFAFDATKVECTKVRGEGPEFIWRARCVRCNAIVPPDSQFMREHAILHLAVGYLTKVV